MQPTTTPSTDSATGQRLLSLDGLQALVDALAQDGFQVIAPVVRDGAIGYGPITQVSDLPVGWGDEQDAGSYRLRRRDDEMVFGYATGAQSAKPVFFPARDLFWRAHREDDGGFTVEDPPAAEGPFALLGVRSCDLSALGIHDTVLLGRGHIDASYAVRREDAFVVAVTCSDPGGTCFCVSMGTGPRPRPGQGAAYDLSLTEIARRRRAPVRGGGRLGPRGRGHGPDRRRHRRRRGLRGRRRGRRARGRADGPHPGHGRPQGAAVRECRQPACGTTSPVAACPARTARWSARPASAPTSRTSPTCPATTSAGERIWDSCFDLRVLLPARRIRAPDRRRPATASG